MANYSTLKAAIADVIKTNGNNAITGALLQQSLLAMVDSLGDGYQFAGVADGTTNPGTPDQRVFWIPVDAGTYANFGGLNVAEGEIAIFVYNGTWRKMTAVKQSFLGPKKRYRFYLCGGDVSIVKDGTSYVFTLATNVTVFDWYGGYRFIQAGTYTLPANKNFYLSTNTETLDEPDLDDRGNGQSLYLFADYYSAQGLSKQTVVAANFGNQLYSPFPIFSIEKPQHKFWINTIIKYGKFGTTVAFGIPDNYFVVYDGLGGYRKIQAGAYVINGGRFIFLSASDSGYVPVDWGVKGNGETVYIYQCPRETLTESMTGLIGFNENGQIVNGNFEWEVNPENFYILGTPEIKVISEQQLSVKITNQLTVFDAAGGYWFIDPVEITVTSGNNLYLSVSNTQVETPTLANGTGGKLYLMPSPYANPHTGYLVIAFWAGKFYSPFFSLTKEEIPIDPNIVKESNGLLPVQDFNKTGFNLGLFEHIRRKDKDITIVHLGDSISTNNSYASALADAAYRPPRMEEKYLVHYIEEKLRWRGQQYRRSDAMTEKGGSTPMFTEVCTSAENKYFDAAWDMQLDTLAQNYYRLWTRVLSGTDCSVSFVIPAGMLRAGFIYRTDYLCAASTIIKVLRNGTEVTGAVQCRLTGESNFVEANNRSFSMQETNEILTGQYTDYNGSTNSFQYRVSKGQRRVDFKISSTTDITIVITNSGSGRLNYWGVEMSPYENIIRYVNMARGGQNISLLRNWEQNDVDAFAPDAIIYQSQIINEGAMSVVSADTPNTPSAFATRFSDYLTALKNKAYTPEILSYVLFIGVQANIVDQTTGKYNRSYINSIAKWIDTYVYIGELEKAIELLEIPFVNCFERFVEIAYRKAEIENTNNIWTSAINASGATGDTFTCDTVHLNDYGNLIAWRLLMKSFNF